VVLFVNYYYYYYYYFKQYSQKQSYFIHMVLYLFHDINSCSFSLLCTVPQAPLRVERNLFMIHRMKMVGKKSLSDKKKKGHVR
jgi:hypothetical protein